MPLDAVHYNYLFLGKKYCDLTLFNSTVFPLVIDALTPLLACTNVKKCRICSEPYVRHARIKLGRPRWNAASLLEVCRTINQYVDDDSLSITALTAEFPSVDSAYARRETVDVYLSLENDLVSGKAKSKGDCGLHIVLREDVFAALGAAVVGQVLHHVYTLFDSARLLFHKRTWWSGSGNESALHDVAAWRALHPDCARLYRHWKEVEPAHFFLPENVGTG